MTGVVIASRTLKTAYIFPSNIQGIGWSVPENLRTQQLSGSAPFESFTQSNSAYIIHGELPRVVPDPEVVTPPPPPPVEEVPSPAEEPPPPPPPEESEENSEEETATTTPPTENQPQETASSTEESSNPPEQNPAPEPTPAPTPETPAPAPEETTPSETLPPASEENASSTENAFFGESLLSFFLPKVSAQEIVATTTPVTETSTPPVIDAFYICEYKQDR
jgi:hypothetical protein